MIYIFFLEMHTLLELREREREDPCNQDKNEDGKRSKKSPFSLHDDISTTGTRIGTSEKVFQRESFHASNDLSLVHRKSLSSELQRFEIFPILIRSNRI